MTEFLDLVNRVIMQESGGDPNAVSPVGAAGLMQIMADTGLKPGFGVSPIAPTDRLDPVKNRAFGESYLQAMLQRYGGDPERALVAYNFGPGNADVWDGNRGTLPRETQTYLQNILGDSAQKLPTQRPIARPTGMDALKDILSGDAFPTFTPPAPVEHFQFAPQQQITPIPTANPASNPVLEFLQSLGGRNG